MLCQLPPSATIRTSWFNLHAWQSFSTTSLPVLFGLPLGLGLSTSYSMHFFTQSSPSFRNTCPYHRSLFCCNANVLSSIPNLSLSSILGNLSFSWTPHIHLTILISARWSATSFLAGQISLPCNILLRTQLLYNLPLIINDTSLLVSIAWTYSNQFGFWPPQLHQHLHPHSACHLINKTYPLTTTLRWPQYPH